MTREEHVKWCKARALEYLRPGEHYSLSDAVASMLSDMGAHDETKPAAESCAPLGMFALMSGSEHEVRRFIEGFN